MVYGVDTSMPNGGTTQYDALIFLCIVTPTVSIGYLIVFLSLQPQAYKHFCAMITCRTYDESLETHRGSLELSVYLDNSARNTMHPKNSESKNNEETSEVNNDNKDDDIELHHCNTRESVLSNRNTDDDNEIQGAAANYWNAKKSIGTDNNDYYYDADDRDEEELFLSLQEEELQLQLQNIHNNNNCHIVNSYHSSSS